MIYKHITNQKACVQIYEWGRCDSAVCKREKCSICTITFVYFLPLLPCYEAIHHKILDSEEITLYIEGQHCHLEGESPVQSPPRVCSQ